jgi:hypothetical protein
MKNSNRTGDLPACSAVPRPTTLFVGPTFIPKPSHLPWIRKITVRIGRIYQQYICPPHVTLRAVNGGGNGPASYSRSPAVTESTAL